VSVSSRCLSPAELERFETDGYLSPLPALTPGELARCQAGLQGLIKRIGPALDPPARHKPHLCFQWASDLVRHPAILDVVADLLGDDLLVWRSVLFAKPPRDPRYVAWHQDWVYWGLNCDDVVTAWVALTESNRENGCVRVVAGSHRQAELPHTIQAGSKNQLVRGQIASVRVPEESVTDLVLAAGQLSVHHVRLLHGSRGNASERPRIGLAIRYLATRVKQRGPRQSASLVRGTDRYGHFDHEPAPRFDYDPVALAWHARSLRRYGAELLWEALMRPTPRNLISFGRMMANPGMLRAALHAVRAWAGGPRVSPGGSQASPPACSSDEAAPEDRSQPS